MDPNLDEIQSDANKEFPASEVGSTTQECPLKAKPSSTEPTTQTKLTDNDKGSGHEVSRITTDDSGRRYGSYGDLKADGIKDAHHIIQDAAVRDLPGYNRNDAPAVELSGPSTEVGSEHYEATQAQRQAGGGNYAAERKIAQNSLSKAGLSPDQVQTALQNSDQYFQGIGVGPSTPTRVPGNRP